MTQPICVECGEVLERDRDGIWCPRCFPAQKRATFRAVLQERMGVLSTPVVLSIAPVDGEKEAAR